MLEKVRQGSFDLIDAITDAEELLTIIAYQETAFRELLKSDFISKTTPEQRETLLASYKKLEQMLNILYAGFKDRDDKIKQTKAT